MGYNRTGCSMTPVPVEMAPCRCWTAGTTPGSRGVAEHAGTWTTSSTPLCILRLPGTFNMKDPTNPRPVTVDAPVAAKSDRMAELVAATEERPKVAVAMPTTGLLDGP